MLLCSAAAAPRGRVLLLTAVADDVDSAAGDALPGQLAEELASYNSSLVIPKSDVQRALAAAHESSEACIHQKGCPAALAKTLGANLIVTATLGHPAGKAFLLTVARLRTSPDAMPRSTSEEMPNLTNVGLNMHFCLSRLFPSVAVEDTELDPMPASELPGISTPAPVLEPVGAPAAKHGSRVIVWTSDDGDARASAPLAAQLARTLMEMHAGEVVPVVEARAAFSALSQTPAACLRTKSCVAAVARRLDADALVTATLTRRGNRYQLLLTRSDPFAATEPQSASEQMRMLPSLEMNVRLCLGRLFPRSNAEAAAPAPPAIVPPTAPEAVTRERVIVVAAAEDDVEHATAEALPVRIVQELAARQASEVAPSAAVQRAAVARAGSAAGCLRAKSCVTAVAREMAASIVVTAKLARSGATYVLTLTRGTPSDPEARSTSEHMKRLSSLGLNIELCLRRLFAPAADSERRPDELAP